MHHDLAPILTFDQAQQVPDPVQWIDVRWSLDGSQGRPQWRQGHLPGAVHVDLDSELAAPASDDGGRHPLPSPVDFARAMRRAGVSDDTTVLAHDTVGGGIAARLVWMLRSIGHPAALVLVTADELAASAVAGDVDVPPGTFTARPWPDEVTASLDDVAATVGTDTDVALVDVRDPARFRGDTDPVDPRPGHVPGAHNRPWTDTLHDGVLRDRAELHTWLDFGDDVIVSCGSGVTACHTALVMEHAGLARPRVFVGSWSAWSRHPHLPTATGPHDDQAG